MPIKKTHEQFLEELNIRNTKFPPLILANKKQIYSSTHEKLKFRCTNNHIVYMSPHNVLNGYGCKQCSMKNVGIKNTISHTNFLDKLQKRNEQYSRKIFLMEGQNYHGTYIKLEFKCEYGHIFKTIPKVILKGHGCSECGKKISKQTHQHTIEDYQRLLDNRNKQNPCKKVWLCENQTYTSQRDFMWFKCEQDHRWNARCGDIIHHNSGCPECNNKNYSLMAIDWLDTIAKQQNIYIQHVKQGGEFLIPNTKYKVDGYCKDNNTIYEFYGDAFHGNPLLYNPDDCCHPYDDKITAGELYKKTLEREQIIRNLGYNIVNIWELEWKKIKNSIFSDFIKAFPTFKQMENLNCVIDTNNKIAIAIHLFNNINNDKNYFLDIYNKFLEQKYKIFLMFEDEWVKNKLLILNKINHYMGTSIFPTIHARKCVIRQVTNKEKSNFLNQYHIQGNDNSQISIGAYFNDELVAIMTFSKPRAGIGNHKNKEKNSYELVRFTTNINYRIPGIASKLITYFEKNYCWSELYSYADRCWSMGNLYYKLGFNLDRINPPDYFYIINGKRKHRWAYRKDIIKNTLPNYDPNLTEYQNMLNHGYDRVWNCGTLKFVKKNISYGQK